MLAEELGRHRGLGGTAGYSRPAMKFAAEFVWPPAYALCAGMLSPSVWQTGSPPLHRSMDRPPQTGLVVRGRPNLADGLPNTAMPATKSGVLGGKGSVKPIPGIGTAAITSMTAAPCE